MPGFFRQLLRPLDFTSLLLILVLTLGFAFGLRAGFYGLPIIVLLSSWFFKYAYVLLDSVANGRKETPVLSVEMLNPIDEQRPLAQVVICAGVFFAVRWVGDWVGGWAALAIAFVSLLYLPVSIAVLGVSARAVDAVNPAALTRTIVGLGPYYLLILGTSVLYAALLVFVFTSSLPDVLKIGLGLFLILSLFSSLGGALFERRHLLGYEPTHSPEREAERQDRERSQIRARALDEVYGEARGGNFAAATNSMLRWLREHDVRDLERDARFFFDQSRQWQDEKAFIFMSRFLIAYLLEGGKTGTAVEIVDGVLQRTPLLKLGTAADTLKVAQLARASGRRALTVRILAEFEKQFPGDVHTAEAVTLRQAAER